MNRRRIRGTRPKVAHGPDAAERERIRRAFLAMALAHELKQPLNTLNLNAELLAKRLARSPEVLADASGLLAALGRVVDRVATCLDAFYERVMPDPVPDRPFPIGPEVQAALARATPAARKAGVKLQAVLDPAAPAIPLHRDQLAVALDHLLENAIEASPRGGTVQVRARVGDDELRLEIADQGEGMTPEIARRAVEIGFSTRPGGGRSGGTGLTVAKFIAYHHNGGFQLETRPGGGTTVTMVLPIVFDEERASST